MGKSLRVGLVGLDISHALDFTRLLNDSKSGFAAARARIGRVTTAYAGGTPGWDKSWSRVDRIASELREAWGVSVVSSVEAVASECDVVLVTSADGRLHRGYVEAAAGLCRCLYVGKPFAATSVDAEAMVRVAEERGTVLMSCSPLRYAEPFASALKADDEGGVVGVDVFGPMALDAALPGYLWYGCHGLEMVVAAMGTGCVSVSARVSDGADLLSMQWSDGRMATYRGLRTGTSRFGATLHRERGVRHVEVDPIPPGLYSGLLAAVFRSYEQGRSEVDPAHMIEVVRIIEQGNRARLQAQEPSRCKSRSTMRSASKAEVSV